VPYYRKKFAHFGQGSLMFLKIAMKIEYIEKKKIEKFHVPT